MADWQGAWGIPQVISIQAGSAGLPSLTPVGDLDTGLWSPSANTLAISTGGSERVRIDSEGDLGIGTTSPARKLHIYSADGTSRARMESSSSPGTYVEFGLHSEAAQYAAGIWISTTAQAQFYSRGLALGSYAASSNPPSGGLILDGNVGFSSNSWGTSAASVLSFGIGTAPTTSPADMAQLWVADRNGVAGKSAFSWRDEAGRVGILGHSVPFADVFPHASSDFMFTGTTLATPWWIGGAVNSGTTAAGSGTANHPGVLTLTSSTTPDSGYRFQTSSIALLLAGGESSEFIFSITNATNTTIRLGFTDTSTVTAPVDGVWIDIVGTTLTGKTSSNSTGSTTGTSYTVSTATWYRGKIVLNAGATQANFYLYNESGTQLWTDSLTTNIPTGAGRTTGHGVIATNSGTSAIDLVDMDYMSMWSAQPLTR